MSAGIEPEAPKSAVPLADLSTIDRALEGTDDELREAVKHVRPADLGRDLSRRSIDDGVRLFQAIDERRGAAMLRAAHPAVAGQLLQSAPCERAARFLAFLPTDHQAEILTSVDPGHRAKIESAMDASDRQAVQRLLSHSELTVGRLMSVKIWRAPHTATVAQALDILRNTCDDIEVAVNLYVVDDPARPFGSAAGRGHAPAGDELARLIGVAPLREISVAPPDTLLGDIMTRDPIAVRENAPRGDAADIIRTHDFLSLPVVDAEGRLIGAVRVDDVLDAVLDRVGDGFLNQGGVAGHVAARAPYFRTSLARTVRSRLTWLILLFVAETATGTVLRYFEDELSKVVALSFFVPLLIGTGGNAGSQTVATIIRAAALGEVRTGDVTRVIVREVSTGLLLGVLVAIIAFGRALLWGVGPDLAICVSVTIVCVVTWANAVGAGIPLAAQRLGIDPTVISGPLITTLVDATGLFIYFTVAHLTIAQLHEPPAAVARYACNVVELQPAVAPRAIPACPEHGEQFPCWRIESDASKFTVAVDRGGARPAPDVRVETRCATSSGTMAR